MFLNYKVKPNKESSTNLIKIQITETQKIFNRVENLKHRNGFLLFHLYGCKLKVISILKMSILLGENIGPDMGSHMQTF